MKRVFKWFAWSLVGGLCLLIIGISTILIYGQLTFKRQVEAPLPDVGADTSATAVARGKYLVHGVLGCEMCHSPKPPDPRLSGYVELVDAGPIQASFAAPNLTSDKITGIGEWSDSEIARAIRSGVDREGVELIVMPAEMYRYLPDQELSAVLGYLRTLEPVQNEIPPFQANAFAKGLISIGLLGPRNPPEPIAAHDPIPQSGTTEYGGYLVRLGGCRSCHGERLQGIDGGGPNLTGGGKFRDWSGQEFAAHFRTMGGVEGLEMPWAVYKNMTDEDLTSIFSYLRSLDPP